MSINTSSKDKSMEALGDKELDINIIKDIYFNFKNDVDVTSKIAMNLSIRTSVFNRDKEKSETIKELLIALSESSDMGTRWAVAKNPHTPIEILEKLANDEINLVRALVATNPNTPPTILVKLFSDEKIVRDGLSGNPSTPTKFLNILADDADKMTKLRVAENPSTPKETLERLLSDSNPDVKKASEIKLKENYEKC